MSPRAIHVALLEPLPDALQPPESLDAVATHWPLGLQTFGEVQSATDAQVLRHAPAEHLYASHAVWLPEGSAAV